MYIIQSNLSLSLSSLYTIQIDSDLANKFEPRPKNQLFFTTTWPIRLTWS